jgi:hypothetical protein
MQFRAEKDFEDELDGRVSRYLKGFTYTARPEDEALKKVLTQWAKEGRVTILGPDVGGPGGTNLAAGRPQARGTLSTSSGKEDKK